MKIGMGVEFFLGLAELFAIFLFHVKSAFLFTILSRLADLLQAFVFHHPPPPSLAHARPCLSTGWALNRRSEEIFGALFWWSTMEDWVFVEHLYREREAHSCL